MTGNKLAQVGLRHRHDPVIGRAIPSPNLGQRDVRQVAVSRGSFAARRQFCDQSPQPKRVGAGGLLEIRTDGLFRQP